MINYNTIHSGPLLFQTKLSENDVKNVFKLCKKDKSLDGRHKLVGLIDDEYYIKDLNKLVEILNPYLECFKDAHKRWYNCDCRLKLQTAWVNYMKAGDSNPNHIHTGCNFSSVLFLKIPKGLEKERQQTVANQGAKPGFLSFFINSITPGYISSYEYNPKVGDFFIFPGNLTHCVYSFKSKGERISVACNFVYENI